MFLMFREAFLRVWVSKDFENGSAPKIGLVYILKLGTRTDYTVKKNLVNRTSYYGHSSRWTFSTKYLVKFTMYL